MIDKAQIEQLKSELKQSSKLLISTHRNPDGDAMGSSLALYQVLRKLGKDVKVILPDDFPSFYAWMPFSDDCLVYEHQSKEILEQVANAELIFSLDYNAFHRTTEGLSQALAKANASKVLVDHHREPDQFDLMFWSIEASSTSELIYDLIVDMGWKEHMDISIAECLYTGIVTDTGSFRFSSTSAHTMNIAAELMALGLDSGKVQSQIYDNNSENRLRLMGYALSEKMVINEKESFAYISLSAEELARFSYQKGDTEGLVNYPLSVSSVKISVLVTQRNNEMRMSFRSKADVNVNDLARKYFNGGGHKNAAGGVSQTSMEETLIKLEKVLPEFSTSIS